MKIFFWICWIGDVFIVLFFSFALFTSYISGVMDSKSGDDVFSFLFFFFSAVSLAVAALILYTRRWKKTATLLASIPFLALLFIFLIPVIAYISGERMN